MSEHKLVPVEPTAEMVKAGVRAMHDSIGFCYDGDPDCAVAEVYKAMLAALAKEPAAPLESSNQPNANDGGSRNPPPDALQADAAGLLTDAEIDKWCEVNAGIGGSFEIAAQAKLANAEPVEKVPEHPWLPYDLYLRGGQK